MKATIHIGDCRDVLAQMPDASVYAVVTDPPYELSDDGKASPNRVFLELMFPKNPQIEAPIAGDFLLEFLASEIAGLSRTRTVPRPSSAMPVSSVALHDDLAARDEQVKYTSKGSVCLSDCDLGDDRESESAEYLGCFALKLTDSVALLNALNCAGTGFFAGGLGVGFGMESPRDPRLSARLAAVMVGNEDVGAIYDALANFVGASAGAGCVPVLRLNLGWSPDEVLSADAALVLFAILKSGGAQIVRALPPAGRLSSKLQARRISVVGDSADRALSFDLVIHPQSISSTGFMGKQWDGQKLAFDAKLWAEIYRVLRPGGHLVAFGGTRTHHRMYCAIEDAGFEIRDTLAYMFGSGFPKSLDVSKAIDKAAGLSRPVVSTETKPDKRGGNYHGASEQRPRIEWDRTSAASAASAAWNGWGTALKPAFEPICLARKPISERNVAANVLRWGTGALNIGGCRIDGGARPLIKSYNENALHAFGDGLNGSYCAGMTDSGRWPADVLLDEEAAAMLDEMSGESTSRKGSPRKSASPGDGYGMTHTGAEYSDTGGPSRFFFTAKPSVEERESGLAHVEPRTRNRVNSGGLEHDPKWAPTTRRNVHPTVKPFSLMSWLVRLVTPPSGTVLDPFLGSGTTGMAAVAEGFDFIGIEQDEHFAEIAEGRIRNIAPLLVGISVTGGHAQSKERQ